MSQKRQQAISDRLRDRRSQVVTRTQDYPAGHLVPLHFHDRDQIVFATRGVMTVRTGDGTWIVPTQRAVWIPAPIPHTITMSGVVAMRTLYLRPRLAAAMPRSCCVISISPLLRELIVHACSKAKLQRTIASQRHLIDMILDQLRAIQIVPLRLPHPSDPRALRIAEVIQARPDDRRALSQLCKLSGGSKRTVERLFQQDVGMTFGKWRQQLRLIHALRLLAEGEKVTSAALEAGYSTPSAFISMFKRTLGTTPTLYFRSTEEQVSHSRRSRRV